MQDGENTGVAGDARTQAALVELRGTIAQAFPSATFSVRTGDDPEGVYLIPTVDVADTDAVFDLVADRLLELQVEEGVPVYVFPVRTPERIRAELEAERRRRHRPSILTLLATEPE